MIACSPALLLPSQWYFVPNAAASCHQHRAMFANHHSPALIHFCWTDFGLKMLIKQDCFDFKGCKSQVLILWNLAVAPCSTRSA